MAESLRDQLLKSGIVKQAQAARKDPANGAAAAKNPARRKDQGGRKGPAPSSNPAARGQAEIDLARAYSIRAQTEAEERKSAERAAAELARLRRERKQQVGQLLDGKAQNKAEAELSRNFEHAGKIRRVHVDAGQLAAINDGRLGIVQHAGRYLLVDRALAEQLAIIAPATLALLVDPSATGSDDDGVPDDLIW